MSRTFMRIATWNIDRGPNKLLATIRAQLGAIDADIWILTETKASVIPESRAPDPFAGYVGLASRPESHKEKPGQNKTTIWSRFGLQRTIATFDPDTAVCAEIQTPMGPMIVYGSIITYWGDTNAEFPKQWDRHLNEIERHANDWERIATKLHDPIMCLAGDFNQNRDNTLWFPQAEKNRNAVSVLSQALKDRSIKCVTEQDMRSEKKIPRANIDHICLSDRIAKHAIAYDTWYVEGLSHNGVCIDLQL